MSIQSKIKSELQAKVDSEMDRVLGKVDSISRSVKNIEFSIYIVSMIMVILSLVALSMYIKNLT